MTTPTLPPLPSTIANLPAAPAVTNASVIPISINGVTYGVTAAQLAAIVQSNTIVAGSGIGVSTVGGVSTISLNTALPNGTTATTQSAADNSAKVATTAYVTTAISDIPETSSTVYGLAKVDGTTITASSGVISAVVPTQNYTLISSQTISVGVASVSVTSGITSSYSHYRWEISNLTSATNAVNGLIRVQQGGSWISSNSYNGSSVYNVTSGSSASGSISGYFNSNNAIPIDSNSSYISSTTPSVITLDFWNPSIANYLNFMVESNEILSSGHTSWTRSAGQVSLSAATTGMQLYLSSGNIATCQANLYGIT